MRPRVYFFAVAGGKERADAVRSSAISTGAIRGATAPPGSETRFFGCPIDNAAIPPGADWRRGSPLLLRIARRSPGSAGRSGCESRPGMEFSVSEYQI